MKIRLEDDTGLDLKYLVSDTDRHGTARVYVRRHGRKVRIRELATVEEFMAAYRAALESKSQDAILKPTAVAPGSLRWLVQTYYGCPEFLGLQGARLGHYRPRTTGPAQISIDNIVVPEPTPALLLALVVVSASISRVIRSTA